MQGFAFLSVLNFFMYFSRYCKKRGLKSLIEPAQIKEIESASSHFSTSCEACGFKCVIPFPIYGNGENAENTIPFNEI